MEQLRVPVGRITLPQQNALTAFNARGNLEVAAAILILKLQATEKREWTGLRLSDITQYAAFATTLVHFGQRRGVPYPQHIVIAALVFMHELKMARIERRENGGHPFDVIYPTEKILNLLKQTAIS